MYILQVRSYYTNNQYETIGSYKTQAGARRELTNIRQSLDDGAVLSSSKDELVLKVEDIGPGQYELAYRVLEAN